MALMPKQTKADIKLLGNITLQRCIGLFATLLLSAMFSKLINHHLQIPFMFFSVGSFFYLTKKAPDNPQKEFWQGLINFYIFLISRKKYLSLNSKEYKKTLKKEAERLEQIEQRKFKEKSKPSKKEFADKSKNIRHINQSAEKSHKSPNKKLSTKEKSQPAAAKNKIPKQPVISEKKTPQRKNITA